MFYRPYSRPDADSHRATAIADALAAGGRRGVSRGLTEAELAVCEPAQFQESAVRIGLLLGFEATAEGSEVRGETRGEGDPVAESLVFAGPGGKVATELSQAAARLRELLDELAWRTVLPKFIVAVAIERGLVQHELQTARLQERLRADVA